jgi:hypothetical protein
MLPLFPAATAVLIAEGSVTESVGTFEFGIAKNRFVKSVKFRKLRFDNRGSRRTGRGFNFGVFV